LSFALIIGSHESQSNAQFILQSLGENKTDGYRAENIDCFHRWKPRKVHICLHWFLYPPDNVLLCKAML